MNKYFLSIISIMIILQSLSLVDDFFFQKKKIENSYNITVINKLNKEKKSPDNLKITEINFTQKIKSASVRNGNKLSKKCSGCHDLNDSLKVKIGPPLWKIINRSSGSIQEFNYSKSLINFKKNWSFEELFSFLENPKEYIVGNKMMYKGLKKSEDRFDLIAYLNTLK